MTAYTRQCPVCKEWIPCSRGRIKLDNHIAREHPDAARRQEEYRRKLLGLPKPRARKPSVDA